MPLPAESFHATDVQTVLRKHGLKHLRVRRHGNTLAVESGPVKKPFKHFRLCRDTVHLWRLEMAGHGQRWEKTPFRDQPPQPRSDRHRELPLDAHGCHRKPGTNLGQPRLSQDCVFPLGSPPSEFPLLTRPLSKPRMRGSIARSSSLVARTRLLVRSTICTHHACKPSQHLTLAMHEHTTCHALHVAHSADARGGQVAVQSAAWRTVCLARRVRSLQC